MALPVFIIPGPCKISWDGSDCGSTKEGIRIRFRTGLLGMTCDEGGVEPIDYSYAGKSAVVIASFIDAVGMKNLNTKLQLANIRSADVGKCLVSGSSAIGKILQITERDTNNKWIAYKSFPQDPDELLLSSIRELSDPITWIVAPYEGKLFTTVPSYVM